MSISLLTHGWVCYRTMTIIRRYVLPMELDIKPTQYVNLTIKNIRNLSLNVENIINKNMNLKLTDKDININNDSTNINIDK